MHLGRDAGAESGGKEREKEPPEKTSQKNPTPPPEKTLQKMNAASSRSHLVVSIHVSTLNRQTGHLSQGKLAFVDLAGSERLKKSGSEGQALKEAAAINGSLSALGDVIAALTSNPSNSTSNSNHSSSSSSHVPYRNSKLTTLMADCLGGTAKALMVVAVAPTSSDLQESAAALGWATRARGVCNSVRRDSAGPEVLRLRALCDKWKARAGVPEAMRDWVDWEEVEDVKGGGAEVE